MAYALKGDLLEVCDCRVLCPCWIGEDPDNGCCKSVNAYRINQGTIDGIDVSGLVLTNNCFIPGNVLAGGWRVVRHIDDRATPAQEQALLRAFRGQLGGPLADLNGLVGEEVAVRRSRITFTVEAGRGVLSIDAHTHAEMEPYRSPTGAVTQLVESAFSTIPGSPAFVAKARHYRMAQPELGIDIDLHDHNAIQGEFEFRG